MSVREYSLKFTQLVRYAPSMVDANRSWMCMFVFGVADSVVKECRTVMLIKEMYLSRLMVHALQIDNDKVKEKKSKNKRVRTRSFNFSRSRSEGSNHPLFL